MKFLHSCQSKQQSKRFSFKSVLIAVAISLSFLSCDSSNQPNNNECLSYNFHWSVEGLIGTEDIFLINVHLYEFDENLTQTFDWFIEDILYGAEEEFTRQKKSKYLKIFIEISDRNGQSTNTYWVDHIYDLDVEKNIEINNSTLLTKFEPQ
ncbi:MAG: hypothetical protein MJZ96_01630 [Paludibacteraceae bacterium]|nr:hypothetical protein [Paludibacteraceae bacterium]